MDKNRSYNINPANNGYVLNITWWQERKENEGLDYKSETLIFSDWDEVLVWLKDNRLEVTK